MEFLTGCNYWTTHKATEMWKDWDEGEVRKDLKALSENNVKYIRVFPLWRDFQPIIPCMKKRGHIVEFRLEGDRPAENRDYLDETMLARFDRFLDICDEFGIKVVVGLITGFMSGRLFIPSALFGKDLFKDEMALLFQQRFVRGFVTRFKDRTAVYAWDLGNECHGMGNIDNRFVASNWIGIISNAIRAADPKRPIISGMHGIGIDESESTWSIDGQAEFVDVITTHIYPYWTDCAGRDKIASFRASMHSTYETKMFSDLVDKPCLVEEIGTVGPNVCSEDVTADFLRISMLSNYANGAAGFMWWCSGDFTDVKTIPHAWYMTEVELGMMDTNRSPKPMLSEMKKLTEFLNSLDFELPKVKNDVVCVLTKDQKQWEIGYITHCLAKQSNLSLKFCFGEKQIPEADAYLIPSMFGDNIMCHESFDYITDRVYNHGATLYMSMDFSMVKKFADLTGNTVEDSGLIAQKGSFALSGKEIEYMRDRTYFIRAERAEVLAKDEDGTPIMTRAKYGKGTVVYLNFPLEKKLIAENNAFLKNNHEVYKEAFSELIAKKEIISENKYVCVTYHPSGDTAYCVALNHSPDTQKTELRLKPGWEIDKVYRGGVEELPPFDGAIFRIKKVKK